MASSNDPLFDSTSKFIKASASQPKVPMGEVGGFEQVDSVNAINDRNNLYASYAEVKGQESVGEQQPPQSLGNMSDDQLLEMMNAPLTGEEVAMKIAGLNEKGVEINRDTISLQEFEAYDEWRRKQTHSLWSSIGDGLIGVGHDVGKGLLSAATDWKKNALALGISAVATPAVGFGIAYGSTLLEAFARGTRAFGGLFVTAANHPGSPLYRMFVNPTGDVEQSYQDFLDLSQWNAETEKIFSGKTNQLLPNRATYEKLFGKTFGDQVDDFLGVNHDLATAASYVLDPITLMTFGYGALGKGVATKAAAAALKSGEAGNAVAQGVASTAARNTFKANWLNSLGEGMVKTSNAVAKPIDAAYKWVTETAGEILGTTVSANGSNTALRVSRVRPMAGPTSMSHAVLGVAGVTGIMTIPYGMGIAGVYAGIKGVGFVGEMLIKKGASAGIGAQVAGSGVLNAYLKQMGKSVGHGALYGGAIGYATSGEEGLGHGIGMGIGLGASGHIIGTAYGSVSGAYAKQSIIREFGKHVDHLAKNDKDILQANNLRTFIERVSADHGEDVALRTMSHILGIKNTKNTNVAYLTYNDILKALDSDPNMWVQKSDGNGGTTRVLSELGVELKKQLDKRVQVDADGNLVQGQGWNGMFLSSDGKQKPYMIFKDGQSGKRHILINIDNLILARDANGNAIMHSEIAGTRDVVNPAEMTEGPRPKLNAEDIAAQERLKAVQEADTSIGDIGAEVAINDAFNAPEAVARTVTSNEKVIDKTRAAFGITKEFLKDFDDATIEKIRKDGLESVNFQGSVETNKLLREKVSESLKTLNEQEKRIVTNLVLDKVAELKSKRKSLNKLKMEALKKNQDIASEANASYEKQLKEGLTDEQIMQSKEYKEYQEKIKLAENEANRVADEFNGLEKSITTSFEIELHAEQISSDIASLKPSERKAQYEKELKNFEVQRENNTPWKEALEKSLKDKGIMSKDGSFESKSPTKKPVAKFTGFSAPAVDSIKSRRRSVEVAGPARPIEAKPESTTQVPVTIRKLTGKTAYTAPLGELWHALNEIYREETHGQTIVSRVQQWLLGDENNKGVAFTDTKQAVKFMNDAYSKLVGPVASDRALQWREAINEFEKTGKLTKESAAALDKFCEEIGEAMFLEWERGRPVDYVLRGGDLGFARNLILNVNDGLSNLIFREGTNFGADINTSQAFFKWFEQTKSGGKVRFDPIIQSAFKDLVRVYGENGMKDRGTYTFNLGGIGAKGLASTIEQYGLEHRFDVNEKGEAVLLSPEDYGRRQFERGNIMVDELMALAEKHGPKVLDGMDIWVTHNDPKKSGGLGFTILDKMSRESNQATLDTLGRQGEGFLFQGGDFSDIGQGLSDLHKAQIEGTRTKGVYLDRGYDLYGARGRPRTTPSGKMLADLKKARERGHTIIMRGIPTAEAYKIIAKHLPKTSLNALNKLAPIIADGGHSMDNVISVLHNGFTQTDATGKVFDRTKGATITPRTTNFVPYDLELRVTLKNNRSPSPATWAKEHLAYIVKGYDIDALTRRGNEIWRDNPELQKSYNHINEFITDIHRTIDEYSGSSQIPASKFFGETNIGRRRRKYVVAAIGASPNKAYQGHELFASEGEWHASQFKNYNNQYNSPFMNLRMDNILRFQSIDGERMRVRMNEKVYYRSMVPTPKEGYGRMFERSYQEGDTGGLRRPEPLMSPEEIARLETDLEKLRKSPLAGKNRDTKVQDRIERLERRISSAKADRDFEGRRSREAELRFRNLFGKDRYQYQSPDEAIPLNIENPMDYSESVGFDYSEDAVRENVNNTKALIKTLEKMPQFQEDKSTMRFQQGETWGATSEQDAQFLRSNWKWATEQGDIFLAESTKRYLNQFGQEVNVIRHTLEEHLEAGGTVETYNKDIKTGKAVVMPVQHGTGSLEFLKDPTFKPEFLGRTTRADSARMGYFFAGIQETAHSYAKMAGFSPFGEVYSGRVSVGVLRDSLSRLDINALAKRIAKNFKHAGKLDAWEAFQHEVNKNLPTLTSETLKSQREKEMILTGSEKDMDGAVALKHKANVEKILREEYRKITNLADRYIDKLRDAERAKAKIDDVETGLMEGGYDFDSLLDGPYSWFDLVMRDEAKNEAWEYLDNTWNKEESLRDGSPAVTLEDLNSYWSVELSRRTMEMQIEKLDNFTDYSQKLEERINTVIYPEENRSRMMRSFIGYKNPFVYDFKGQGRSAGPRFGEIYRQALASGHDGIILQNIHDRGPNDNILSIPIGREKAIFVTDTSLSDKPAPRNSGYKEGGRYLHQAPDEALPAGAFSHNNPETVAMSRKFKSLNGITLGDGKFIIKINPDKSFKVGMEYDRMKHDPFNPLVRKSYEAFANETLQQMQLIIDHGYAPEMHYAESEPYAGSREAISDIRSRKRLKVLATDLNFGDRKVTQADINENPLLKMSQYKDANGVPMRINDVFRFVHDFFGHSERGNGFGPLGEENAWDVHARMYSPLARRAMTSGTRGQNSWVNFVHQPNIEINQKREMARRLEREGRYQEAFALRQTIGQTRFADQKIGLMPEWTSKFDDEYTPIEREIYGTHRHAEGGFGLYQGGDEVHNIHSPDANSFVESAMRAKKANKFGSSVSIKSAAEYEGYTLLMAGEGRAHATISPDGELGGVIRGENGTADDVHALMKAALSTGKVKWLNAFDTILPSMYGEYGFEAVARMPFNDEYKPVDWDYQLYGKYNAGRPDVIFMARTKEKANYELSKNSIPTVKEWDDGVALTMRKLEIAERASDAMPDPLKFQDTTGNTRQEIKFRQQMLEYADYVRFLDQQIKDGQVKQEQRMAMLTRWHKQNKTEQTANSWSIMLDAEGKRIKVEEFTKEHLDGLVSKLVRNDSNFRKAEREAMALTKVTAEVKVNEAVEQLIEQTTVEKVEGTETKLQMLKRIYQERYREQAIKYLSSLSSESGAKLMKGIDKTYEKREMDRLGKLREESDARNAETKAKMKKRDELELRFIKENEEARANNEEIPHPDVLDSVDLELRLWEAERDKAEIEMIDKEIEQMSPEDYEILAKARREKLGHASSVEQVEYKVQTPEEIRAEMEEINSLAYEGKLPDGHRYEKFNGQLIWDDVSFHEEFEKRIELNEALKKIIESGEEVKKSTKAPAEQKSRFRVGTLEHLAKEKYANSEWFDSQGRSIKREYKKENGEVATILGLPENGQSITVKIEGKPDKVLKWDELSGKAKKDILDKSKEIYPDEYTQTIDKVRGLLDELRDKPIESQREKLLSLLALMELWGFEINPNLSDSNFTPNVTKSSMSHTEGWSAEATMREFLKQSGALFTSMEGPAIYGDRLSLIPELFDSTVEIISAITMGAEFTQVDKATGKIKAASDIDLKKPEGQALVNEWKDDFLKQYPEWKEFLVRKSTEEVSSNAKDNAWKDAKKAFKKKHGRLPDDAERADIKATIEKRLESKRSTYAETWIGNFFKGGEAESVESRVLDNLKQQNEGLKKKHAVSKSEVEQARLLPEETPEQIAFKKQRLKKIKRTSFSSDESLAQEARKTAKDIRMAFIEWMFTRANEYIQDAAIEFQENQGYNQKKWQDVKSPDLEQARRRQAQKTVEVEELRAEEEAPVEPEAPAKPVVQATETPAVAEYKKPAQPTQAPITEKQRQAQALQQAIEKAQATGNVRQTGNLTSAIDKARAEQTPEKPRNLATAIAEAKAREEAERARRASQPAQPSVPPPVQPRPATPAVKPPVQPPKPVTPTSQYAQPIGPVQPPMPAGSSQYDKPIGPRRPAGRPPKPVETSQVAKDQIADNSNRQIQRNTVLSDEKIAQAQVKVEQSGFIGTLSMNDRAAVEAMLSIKDHLTLKQVKKGAGFFFKSEDSRYMVNKKKSGSYEVTMNSHISPYNNRPVDGKVVAVVPTLEHAQIIIREFDSDFRKLVDQSGGNSSATHQAQAPVMTPQQIDQATAQLTKRAQQNPSAPVVSPANLAQTNPHFNSAVDALRVLGTPATAAKERVKAAIDELGPDAQLNDIIKKALQKSQVVAQSIAATNKMHADRLNFQTTAVDPSKVNNTTIMPTNAGVVEATGKSLPSIAGITDSGTQSPTTPTIDKNLAAILQSLAQFKVYQTKYKLLNGQIQTGKTYVNSQNFMISQKAPNKFMVTGPQGVYIGYVESEEDGMNRILKHFYGNASNRP